MAKHYIRLDGQLITKSFSTDFEEPIQNDICVNEDGGRHFNLDLIDEDGLPKLKYKNKKIVPVVETDVASKKLKIKNDTDEVKFREQMREQMLDDYIKSKKK